MLAFSLSRLKKKTTTPPDLRRAANDLISLDPELYRHLNSLRNLSDDALAELGLDFTIVENEFGEARIVDLVPRGAEINVTRENLIRYIYAVANHRLNVQVKSQASAFRNGMSELVDASWLRMFNHNELQLLISGSGALDVVDLRENVTLQGFDSADRTVEYFFQVVEELTPEQQHKLLKFVTSCSRPPLLGFKFLNPRFTIQRVAGDNEHLPTASTCFNLLKLCEYNSKAKLKEKLIYAIESAAGFEFT